MVEEEQDSIWEQGSPGTGSVNGPQFLGAIRAADWEISATAVHFSANAVSARTPLHSNGDYTLL
jgi:hypothetical protein